jgi:hypothetical protein
MRTEPVSAYRDEIKTSNVVDFRRVQIMAALRRIERAEAGNVDDLIWVLSTYGGPKWFRD